MKQALLKTAHRFGYVILKREYAESLQANARRPGGGLRPVGRPMREIGEHRAIFCFGGSSAEVFDYIFNDYPQYYSFWHSGQKGRGAQGLISAISSYLANRLQDSYVIIGAGTGDVTYHLQHVANTYGVIDAEEVILAAVAGYTRLEQALPALGCRKVRTIFYTPIVDLPPEYWQNVAGFAAPLPNRFMAKCVYEIARRCEHTLRDCVNLLPITADPETFLARPEFCRVYHDHHLSFIRVTPILASHVQDFVAGWDGRVDMPEQEYAHHPRREDMLFNTRNPVWQKALDPRVRLSFPVTGLDQSLPD
ncbi:hypothetical protein ACFFJB_01595 [Camelimonas abortus]|uniref:Uncharacterized protein n=1 Tax=Camelimonas abortus TaxID=1017184 RepID=A0ABV7LGI1_9HYPH